MKAVVNVLLALALVATFAARAHAQSLSGNLFAGTGAFFCCEGLEGAWQVGAGVDLPVTPHVSVGGDFAFIGVVSTEPHTSRHGTNRLISFSGSYHIGRGGVSRSQLFFTGGLGVAPGRDAASGGLLIGSGIDRWFDERRGLRVEVCDQLLEEYGTTHLLTVRAALLFR